MNLYSSKIIKSETVKIVDKDGNGLYLFEESHTPPSARKATAAQERLQQAVQQAFENGMAEGISKGRDLQVHESSHALKAAEEAIKQIGRLRTSIIERSEREILGLAFAIAEKVIHHEVTVNRNVVGDVLKSAVKALSDKENIRVRCHPGDLAMLCDLRPELLTTTEGLRNVEFIEDSAIKPGGVKIETGIGEVDARIDKQFEVIKNAILS
jgi:flagellar assembly protein FliH